MEQIKCVCDHAENWHSPSQGCVLCSCPQPDPLTYDEQAVRIATLTRQRDALLVAAKAVLDFMAHGQPEVAALRAAIADAEQEQVK